MRQLLQHPATHATNTTSHTSFQRTTTMAIPTAITTSHTTITTFTTTAITNWSITEQQI